MTETERFLLEARAAVASAMSPRIAIVGAEKREEVRLPAADRPAYTAELEASLRRVALAVLEATRPLVAGLIERDILPALPGRRKRPARGWRKHIRRQKAAARLS